MEIYESDIDRQNAALTFYFSICFSDTCVLDGRSFGRHSVYLRPDLAKFCAFDVASIFIFCFVGVIKPMNLERNL